MFYNKVYIKTWGCQMNEYDSLKIADLINEKIDCTIIKTADTANILILNTCSIREKAQEKLFHQLGRWKYLKQNNPEIIICVGGCVATQEGERIFYRAHYVDIIFGPQTLHRLPQMIYNVRTFKKKLIDISFPQIEKFNYFPIRKTNAISAFITIIEGCNKYCTYCIVPYTRGKEISRPYKDIILEIQQLTQQGVKEIHLLGQNVNAYKYIDKNNYICTFAKLLSMIAKINGIYRIRYTTSHPKDFSDDLINVYNKIPQLVNFIHLPVQSGSDKILSLMKRRYSINEYKHILEKIKNIRPHMQISSDFIVGFPGETTEDINKTITLILDMDIDMSYSFIYSSRPGTPASKMLDTIDMKEKKQRLYLIQYHINKQTKKFSAKMLNTIQTILVEGIAPQNNQYFFGRTENNRTVFFKSTKDCIGKIVNIKINHFYLYTLYGNLVSIHQNN
ncbi:tRNA (N6-isopentenyl adenosine(37)-C2)-methylthiotransferase MiaB [Enterobacteriaceae endosymbiont of Neohaemonia nigricornis]|uniref:tRNA (N6-isopentenyl adenosine(37)-C2)-methylthiotransferase MiaB n=1 Tax=Enterobacteriaceae endosymbiont of Neohaemonia nigricornis TaxID=2675792 RepID=UPI001449326D|nr:tRNA (N6-isopentenyl adenosine(37)-C2)-methylthiotransferase MiaB [Enterobacteriaceae endosymbiont of Neohaemonia nigricornis]QJC30488.1 tRNA (N6-isopentenyl adenosine(37)-C2)-methylthiotransferase MiaB [Enterobacteriaceae endosymbiont of Neohaemonia nigricornis]